MRALEEGSSKRATAATAMNHTSSRSHAIFTLFIDGSRREISEAETNDNNSALDSGITVKFHLVDLAGSERAKKTQATGNRFKEGTAINMGLLSLGNVISALGDEAGSKHIPYRDSKLTRLLQDSLGGNSHTLMIACVSPADYNIEETLSTLRYADRARKIKNKPIVNIDDKNEVVARLRREILELKTKIVPAGLGKMLNVAELDEAKKETSDAREETRHLQNALFACQEEMGHMNEKLLISEASGETLKTKLKELASEADLLAGNEVDLSAKGSLIKIAKRIHEIVDIQTEGEKKLDEHDLTRFNTSAATILNGTNGAQENSVDNDTGNEDLNETVEATQRRKQSTLANELANLNKVLAQKEQLASSMKLNDDKLKEVKEKYENSMKALEVEIAKLQKQKDDLNQQQKTDSKSKIAEQRRVRIQDLEHQMSDLRKKVLEQQRAIKLNDKNESKVKILNEDIRGMKAAKCKLIKQMKVDADRVRVWKSQKEREVASLKQTERKQQVKIAKMESLHTKKQNVLQRKMEEAQVAKKRLEEIINKQKASKARLVHGKQGLAGAVERIRELVNHELDVVVTIKDATKSKENLLEDRIELTKQLNEIQKKLRLTMAPSERNDMDNKRKQIQEELSARTLEIQNLQKQIMQIKENTQGATYNNPVSNGATVGERGWWDTVQTMTEAKLAMELLFTKSSDLMGQSSINSSELTELKSLYDEACTNSVNLENEIKQMKSDHIEEVNSVKREYEDAQCILLSKLTNPEDCPQITEQEANKFSEIQKRVTKMMIECSSEVNSEGNNTIIRTTQKKKSPFLNIPKANKNKASIEEFLRQEEASFTEDEVESNDEEDPDWVNSDWVQTPLYRRIKQVREQNRTTSKSSIVGKRKSSQDEDDDDDTLIKAPPAKRSLSAESNCGCKTGCKTKSCSCVKASNACGSHCKCSVTCSNKSPKNIIQPGIDSSSVPELTMTLDNTAAMLNATFDIPEDQKGECVSEDRKYLKEHCDRISSSSPSKFPSKFKRNSIFPSPIGDRTPISKGDRTPMNDVSNSFNSKSIRPNL